MCCGKATKVCELLTNKDKTYRAVCRLGIETDTQDTTGTILKECSTEHITEEMLRNVIAEFQGDIEQIPPMYSALKVNGKKLYELAREGKTIERKPRPVHIEEIIVENICLEEKQFTMTVTCSKGTYIRTLCHDIGKRLGSAAAMESLVRTRVAMFTIEDALTLDEISQLAAAQSEEWQKKIYAVDTLFPTYPKLQVKSKFAASLQNGNKLYQEQIQILEDKGDAEEDRYLMYDENGIFKAVYQKIGKEYKVLKMF